jgi:hypothetical protein
MMADAFLSFAATVASSGGTEPTYTFAKVSFFRSVAQDLRDLQGRSCQP